MMLVLFSVLMVALIILAIVRIVSDEIEERDRKEYASNPALENADREQLRSVFERQQNV